MKFPEYYYGIQIAPIGGPSPSRQTSQTDHTVLVFIPTGFSLRTLSAEKVQPLPCHGSQQGIVRYSSFNDALKPSLAHNSCQRQHLEVKKHISRDDGTEISRHGLHFPLKAARKWTGISRADIYFFPLQRDGTSKKVPVSPFRKIFPTFPFWPRQCFGNEKVSHAVSSLSGRRVFPSRPVVDTLFKIPEIFCSLKPT